MSLDQHERDLTYCTYCPKLCRFCCPTAEIEKRETVTPWGKMLLANAVRRGELTVDRDIGETFYHCFSCLHCRTHCRHGNDVPAALMEARARALSKGMAPEAVLGLLDSFRQSNNPVGKGLKESLLRQVNPKFFLPEASAILFLGCKAIQQEYWKPISELFDRLGVDFMGVFSKPSLCCGIGLWQAGDIEGFLAHAQQLRRDFSSYRLVVSPCPTCVYVLKNLFGQLGYGLAGRVEHTSEFFLERIEKQPIVKKLPGKYTFHDPCYLTRYLDIGQIPRRLLASVLEEPLRGLTWSGEDAFCCGGGGLVPEVLPHVAQKTAQVRLAQLRATKADQIITACPGCQKQLGSEGNKGEVRDLTEILLEATLGVQKT